MRATPFSKAPQGLCVNSLFTESHLKRQGNTLVDCKKVLLFFHVFTVAVSRVDLQKLVL